MSPTPQIVISRTFLFNAPLIANAFMPIWGFSIPPLQILKIAASHENALLSVLMIPPNSKTKSHQLIKQLPTALVTNLLIPLKALRLASSPVYNNLIPS